MGRYTYYNLYLEDLGTNKSETSMTTIDIQKWVEVQKSFSSSLLLLFNYSILRFGFSDVKYLGVNSDLDNHSPFLKTFQNMMSSHIDLDGSEVDAKSKKVYRTPLIKMKMSDSDIEKYSKWIATQSSLSASIRALILESVKISGFTNITTSVVSDGLTLFHTHTKAFKSLDTSVDSFNTYLEITLNALLKNEISSSVSGIKPIEGATVELRNDNKSEEIPPQQIIQPKSPEPKKPQNEKRKEPEVRDDDIDTNAF